jgi:hypothetical protein
VFGALRFIAQAHANLCVLELSGAVRCVGDWPLDSETGMRNQDFRKTVTVTGLGDVQTMKLSTNRGCAILKNGSVQCWGNTTVGTQNWIGAPTGKLEAVDVAGLKDVVDLALGWSGSCALSKDGTVTCWGPPFLLRAAPKTGPAPRKIAISNVTQIAGDKNTACAVRSNGTVACWGPKGETVEDQKGISDAVEISVGDTNICARTKKGDVDCWSAEPPNELGTLKGHTGPTHMSLLHDVTQVAASHSFACVLTKSHEVLCWGDNGNCVMGDQRKDCLTSTLQGTTGPVDIETCPMPQHINLPITPVRISLGSGTGCAQDEAGATVCWGRSLTENLGGCGAKPL